MEEENESPSGSQGNGAVSAQKGGLVIRTPGERGCDAQGSGYRWRHRHHAHQQVVGQSDIDEGNAKIVSGKKEWMGLETDEQGEVGEAVRAREA